MLKKNDIDAPYCYQRAEEARRMIENSTDPNLRKDFEGIEAHWLRLARSYDFTASLNTLLTE